MTFDIIVLVVVNILNLIDYVQTMYAVKYFGISIESNPFVRFLLEHNCMGVVKLGLPIIWAVFYIFIIKKDKLQLISLCLAAIFYFFLVLYNFGVLEELGLL